MSLQADTQARSFPPHPGKITFHEEWNHTDRVEDATSIPDGIKYVLYDANGAETSDTGSATRRVPVLEITTRSVDATGKPVAPNRATIIEITSYGPEHRPLRHTTARVPRRP